MLAISYRVFLLQCYRSGGVASYLAAAGASVGDAAVTLAGHDPDGTCLAATEAAVAYPRCCADVAGCTIGDAGAKEYSMEPTPTPTHRPTPQPTHAPAPVPTPKPTSDGCSKHTCAHLGWEVGHGAPAVCAEAAVGGACSGLLTFDEAFHRCDDVGARLCSIDEV